MDPALIQRLPADDGELYTVVNKTPVGSRNNSRDPSPEIRPRAVRHLQDEEEEISTSIPKYSHLVHNRRQLLEYPRATPLIAAYSHIRREKPPPSNGPAAGRYDDVSTKKLVLTPISPSHGGRDNEMWMKVKWQTVQGSKESNLTSSGKRSSSQTALDQLQAQEEYANLSELASEGPFVAQQQRRHSFSEGEGPIIIVAAPNPHSSIIPIGALQGAVVAPSNGDDDYYSIPDEDEDKMKDLEDSDMYTVPPDANEAIYGNVPNPEEDYVNFDADQLPHDYLNEAELREQLRAGNPPGHAPPRAGIKPAMVIQQKIPASGIKDIIMENLRIRKPLTKTVIQSAPVIYEDRKSSMPGFQISGENKLQVGRGDYMEFDLDSWGSKGQKSHDKPSHIKNKPLPQSPPPLPPAKEKSLPQSPPPPPPAKPPPVKRTPSPMNPPQVSPRPRDQQVKLGGDVSPKSNRKPASVREPPPKPPYPAGMKGHKPLQAIKSQPLIDKSDAEKPKKGSQSTANVFSKGN